MIKLRGDHQHKKCTETDDLMYATFISKRCKVNKNPGNDQPLQRSDEQNP